ncbi:Decapping nuclease dxo, partial [Globisporangium splendens]
MRNATKTTFSMNEHAPRPNKRPRRDETRERKRVTPSGRSSRGTQREPSGRAFHYRVPRADDLLRQEPRCSLSKLRYKEPKIGSNLLHGIETYVPKEEQHPDAHPAPIAPILAALEHFQGNRTDVAAPHFVTFRNNLNKIMGTPYNSSSEWTFLAEKRNGCVYLDVRRTQSDLDAANRGVHENQRHGAYAGRQFEIASTHAKQSEHDGEGSSSQPSGERVVNEDEEYCGLFASTLVGKRLVIAAEIDCLDGSKDNYVELKTFRVLQREKDQFVFERFKLLAFWIQSFIVGIPKIVCGFRNDDFELCKLQTFKTVEIPSFCRKYWSPTACLNFTSSFLDWVYATAQEERVYQLTYAPRQHVIHMTELSTEAQSSISPSFLPTQVGASSTSGIPIIEAPGEKLESCFDEHAS